MLTTQGIAATVVSLIAAGSFTAPGSADTAYKTSDTTPTSITLTEVQDSIEDLDDGLVIAVSEDAKGIGSSALGEGDVRIPADPEVGVSIILSEGQDINISLPLAEESGGAVELDNGAVVFSAQSSASTVVVGDLGIQMLTTINDATAPTSYSYELQLAESQQLSIIDGLPAAIDDNGDEILNVSTPWAKDSNGKDVPTHYTVSGNTVTQIVDHVSAPDVAYPVVADPIWAPWVYRCLLGIGLNGPQIVDAMAKGNIWAVVGKAGWHCLRGK